jgi:hypothetical protein
MHKPTPATVLAATALFVSLGGIGLAADGGNLILGKPNTATSATLLSAPVSGGKALTLTNPDATSSSSTALALNVASGHAPLAVNSSARVANLNADLLDGRDPSAIFWQAGAHTGSTKLPNAKGTWTTVAKTSFTLTASGGWVMEGQDSVSLNNGSQPGSANLRFLVNGAVDDNAEFPSTIGLNSAQAITGLLKCNGMPAGKYTVELQVETFSGGGGSFNSNLGSLAVLGD